jgi:hypothetical protein
MTLAYWMILVAALLPYIGREVGGLGSRVRVRGGTIRGGGSELAGPCCGALRTTPA